MQFGMIGLGRMGGNDGAVPDQGWPLMRVYDVHAQAVEKLADWRRWRGFTWISGFPVVQTTRSLVDGACGRGRSRASGAGSAARSG